MQVKSTYKYAKISAFKAREVTREIQGLPVSAALDIVTFSPKKASLFIAKTLKSAIAKAENTNDLRSENLVVKEATVGEGSTIKRSRPRARGSASPIRKRTAHIFITLTDEIVIPTRDKTKKSAKPKAKKTASTTAKATKKPVSSKVAEPIEALNETSSETKE